MNKLYLNKIPILEYMLENNLSVTEFCQIGDIDYRTFNNYIYGEKPVQIKVLFKFARIINIAIEDLIILKWKNERFYSRFYF